ncbi:hypothetical protein SODALDRAFT_356646 [Sodiomyces alkalinus F11]|uniref:Uncharacterized protein n=1 Tax=Sodiomyces alkalinus (strain CBS 110278 / VKM F-3762 / F11) TaxID=1314773 RepID=A0A3N2Q1Q3_SODAK|nr:hypothetical protein SODALDRAFT_356646 [Sodiomyces alkalinus F11]ROT40636.1 hypothetical protein SODALDRAFT_356646 [Sodiomyces alkalinus F11]
MGFALIENIDIGIHLRPSGSDSGETDCKLVRNRRIGARVFSHRGKVSQSFYERLSAAVAHPRTSTLGRRNFASRQGALDRTPYFLWTTRNAFTASPLPQRFEAGSRNRPTPSPLSMPCFTKHRQPSYRVSDHLVFRVLPHRFERRQPKHLKPGRLITGIQHDNRAVNHPIRTPHPDDKVIS